MYMANIYKVGAPKGSTPYPSHTDKQVSCKTPNNNFIHLKHYNNSSTKTHGMFIITI